MGSVRLGVPKCSGLQRKSAGAAKRPKVSIGGQENLCRVGGVNSSGGSLSGSQSSTWTE